MQLGMIGLGRMGANMVRRLLKGGHNCVVYDRSADATAELVKDKGCGTSSLAEFGRGSVIASWLLELSATALLFDPALKNFAGRASGG